MANKKKPRTGVRSPIVRNLVQGLCLLVMMAFAALPADASTVFVNELHYDNSGADAGEGVEIAGPAGTDLAGWSVLLYDGSAGTLYDTQSLSGLIPDQQNGFGTLFFAIAGIQNGATGAADGLALADIAGVVQFLSYEGAFTAANGPAAGMISVDIGVAESGTTPLGFSLQLAGNGVAYADFSWSGPANASPGTINPGQSFAPVPLPASLWLMGAGLIVLGSSVRRPRPIDREYGK